MKIFLLCNIILINLLLVLILHIIFIVVIYINLLRDGSLCWWWNNYNFQVKGIWIFSWATIKITNWKLLCNLLIVYCGWGQPPPPFKYIFSRPTVDSVLDSVIISDINQSKKLLTVLVNTSAGGPGGWFCLWSPVLDTTKTNPTPGTSTSLSLMGRSLILSKIGRVHGEVFKDEKRCDTVNRRFL